MEQLKNFAALQKASIDAARRKELFKQ